jgi:hypothetical protein
MNPRTRREDAGDMHRPPAGHQGKIAEMKRTAVVANPIATIGIVHGLARLAAG